MHIDYEIKHNDYNYVNAINHDGAQYYKIPITITINGKLFVLPFGTKDKTSVHIEGNNFNIVAENSGLCYISLVVIDLNNDNVTSCYLNESDINAVTPNIFDMEVDKQIKILSEYLHS